LVKIRLRRVGAKKKPSYRLVVADARAPRDGAFIEIIGHYNPLTKPETIVIDGEKAQSWLSQGAQPTAIASKLLLKAGIAQKPKPAKAGVAKKPKPAEAAITEEPKPTEAGATKKPRAAKAGVTKKSKPAEAAVTRKSKPTKEKT
jgi:small subunit ribosomal protein S16